MKSIIVAGPTASGKTTLGIQLAQKLGGAVISADSRMVYRGLDIGTGKPTWEYRKLAKSPWITPKISPRPSLRKRGARHSPPPWRKGIEGDVGPVYSIEGIDHYGLDLAAPGTRFTLTDWLAVARPLIDDLQSRGIRPIVVGGTGLYLRALLYGFNPPPTDRNVRTKIEGLSHDELLDALYELDPVTAQRSARNRRRLIRALEVVQLTGRPISDPRNAEALDAVVIAPQVDRSELYRRIDARLHERFVAGLIDEVQGLINSVSEGHERAQRVEWLHKLGLEYRFITDWLSASSPQSTHLVGEIGKVSELEERLAGAIHRYARRQLTYLRHQLLVQWVSGLEEATTLIQSANRK